MTCATCNPPAPGPDRLCEGHVGVRFRDNGRYRWTVTLDGEDVTNRCKEALAGGAGWVVISEKRVCPFGDHVATILQHGNVTIKREAWP